MFYSKNLIEIFKQITETFRRGWVGASFFAFELFLKISGFFDVFGTFLDVFDQEFDAADTSNATFEI